jgi:hypothetical protein
LGKIISVLLLAVILISGCGKFKGEFAFKKKLDDKYTKMSDSVEIDKNDRIDWVYIFHEVKGNHNVGVVLLKKELVWSDIRTTVERITESSKIIYGTIEGLSDGEYRIVLTESNKLIDEKEFSIFSESNGYYDYEEDKDADTETDQ